MRYTLFVGCNIPARVPHYETSARAVLTKLGIGTRILKEFACCGYPMRNADFKTYLLFAARNLALAEQNEQDLMTLCKCCFGSLKKADHLLREDDKLRAEVNEFLAPEGLSFGGTINVTHYLSVIHREIGVKQVKQAVRRKFENLNIATHYGCHALRPSAIMQFDDAAAPTIFDDLVAATGAKSVTWPTRLECCGAPATGINDDLAVDLTGKKVADAKAAGADYLCTACPWCQLQFDSVQKNMAGRTGAGTPLGAILYPQLLGLALGMNSKKLGIDANQIPINAIERFLSQK